MVKIANRCAPRPLLVGDWGTRNFQLNSVQTPEMSSTAGPLEFPCDTLMRPTFCLYPPENLKYLINQGLDHAQF